MWGVGYQSMNLGHEGDGLQLYLDICKGKIACIRISLDLAQVGPTLGVFFVVVLGIFEPSMYLNLNRYTRGKCGSATLITRLGKNVVRIFEKEVSCMCLIFYRKIRVFWQ